ncbi:UNVERIFIED_CONTAM: hypothetical protein Slati_2689200 [Sesamum latifolium]|uniref:Uncharacterized protein n=1 Tax=Sesamum latifolium TaxID=2727402 RepID=A0AAW2VV70_9LAMI
MPVECRRPTSTGVTPLGDDDVATQTWVGDGRCRLWAAMTAQICVGDKPIFTQISWRWPQCPNLGRRNGGGGGV